MNKQFDVAIVGGGLAGSALANALCDFDGKVALIDRNDLLSPESFNPPLRAMAISKGSQKILSAIGVWDTLKPYVSLIERILLSERKVFGSTRISADQEGLSALGYVATNADLLRSMYRANDLRASLELFPKSSVTDVVCQDEYVSLQIKSEFDTQDIQTRLLVLAGGGDFSLAQGLGFKQDCVDYQQTAMVMLAQTTDSQYTTVYERFYEGTVLLALPLKSQSCFAIVWLMKNDKFKEASTLGSEQIRTMANKGFGSCLQIKHLESKRFTYPIELQHVAKPIAKRVVLLGDAAHKIHPFAAQGFNLSLRDVGFLAQCLEDYRGVPIDELLEKYYALRRDDVKRVIRFTDISARLIIKHSLPLAITRGLTLTALDVFPTLRHSIVKRGLGLSGLQSRLACGVPLRR